MTKKYALWLCSFLFAFPAFAQSTVDIDDKASQSAPWEIGEMIEIQNLSKNYRKFLGVTTKGNYLVQEFKRDQTRKESEPYELMRQECVTRNVSLTMDLDDCIDGKVIIWQGDNLKLQEKTLDEGVLQGTVTFWSYFSPYNKEKELHYINGKREGFAYSWYENGQLQSQVYYKNDEPYGKEEYWFEDGSKKSESYYNEKGNKDGTWSWWNRNGTLIEESIYQDNCQLNPVRKWHDNGVLSSYDTYKDCEKNGLSTQWHDNGTKFLEGNYANDKQDGLWQRWDFYGNKDNMTYYQLNFEKFVLDIPLTDAASWRIGDIVFQNDQIERRFLGVIQGEQQVLFIKYNGHNHLTDLTDKQISLIKFPVPYISGGYYFVQDFYIDNKQKASEPYLVKSHDCINTAKDDKWYAECAILGLYIDWYPNGQQALEMHFFSGKPVYYTKKWFEHGQIQLMTDYSTQKQETMWHENGKLYYVASLDNDGKKTGLITYYDDQGKTKETVCLQHGSVSQTECQK